MKESLTYSDIALVPRVLSDIATRDEVDTSITFLDSKLTLPILSAPMKTVTGAVMAKHLDMLGCLGVLARSSSQEDDLDTYVLCKDFNPAVSVGLKGITEQISILKLTGVNKFCIDVANGFNTNIANVVQHIREEIPGGQDIYLIAGNVGSVEGYQYLAELDIDAIRVGIGAGFMCSTSIATGIGMGQVSLIQEINQYRKKEVIGKTPLVIADGGIKEAGDICKALALGADVVMIGTMFAGCTEAPGGIVEQHGKFYKTHAGEASKHTKGNDRYIEGVSTLVESKGSVSTIIKELEDGLKSSMSYMGCKTLNEFRNLPDDCFVKLSSCARAERLPITMR